MSDYKATKLASSREPFKFPRSKFPEIAFAGRSNVGKSSLLNALLFRQKPLAPISKKPGRTRAIDFYLVEEKKVVFVDLPGYGYASVSGEQRASWQPLVESYLKTRSQLALVIILVDSKRGIQKEEWELMGWLNSVKVDWFIVFTKADKLKQNERDRLKKAMSDIGYREDVHYFLVSARTRDGIKELWKLIEERADKKREEGLKEGF